MSDAKLLERIVIDPYIMLGKPTIKGTCLSVEFILLKLAQGSSYSQILKEYGELTKDDIVACMLYDKVNSANSSENPILSFQTVTSLTTLGLGGRFAKPSELDLHDLFMEEIWKKLHKNGIDETDPEFSKLLTQLELNFWSIHCLESEVFNGGFSQYIDNPSFKYVSYALDGYRLINAKSYVDLVERFIKHVNDNQLDVVNEEPFMSSEDIEVEFFGKPYQESELDKMDKEFYQLQKTDASDVYKLKYLNAI